MNSSQVNKQERGWPGHFVSADRCTFTRNTLLTLGEIRVVVSAVGEMLDGGKVARIGWDRYYETMAFVAMWEGPYWVIDVSKELQLTTGSAVSDWTREAPGQANAMHEAAVDDLCERMISPTWATDEGDAHVYRPNLAEFNVGIIEEVRSKVVAAKALDFAAVEASTTSLEAMLKMVGAKPVGTP